MRLATLRRAARAVKIAPLRVPMASVDTRAASAQRKFFAGSLTRPAKGASEGPYFKPASATSRARVTNGWVACGLSSAPTVNRSAHAFGAELDGCVHGGPRPAARSEARVRRNLDGSARRVRLFEKKKGGRSMRPPFMTLS